MKPLLFEIGSEEIPARFVTSGLESLKESIIKLLDDASIGYGNITGFATPRRLAVFIDDVAEKQKDRILESLGPPKKVAFDDQGVPTKAAIGFAKTLNIDVNNLKIKETERGFYVSATVEEKGRPTIDFLAEALPNLISSMHLPKSMRWGDGSLRYFRPIKWILALFGDDIIKFNLNGIKSNNVSYGHRFLSPSAVKIDMPANYLKILKQNYVIADFKERKRVISKGIKEAESRLGFKVHEDNELLDTVTNLVEFPVVVTGSFDSTYTALPKELLITVMKSHQKYFSTVDNDGNILPSFIVISNTKAENNDTVSKGAERVLRARLEDARFYYSEDQKKPFWDYTEELKKVTYQEKLGSIYEKAERVSSMGTFIAGILDIASKEKIHRASMLCKADLVSGVVGEFPELQGYMGMIYALHCGEDKDVSMAVREHYFPRFPGDDLPSDEIGAIISLADKMDNIASFFSLDLIPTGSEDPFALRRQAAGIINILQRSDYPLSLDALIEKALENLNVSPDDNEKLLKKILHFFYPRLEGIFLSQGYGNDIINAALPAGEVNIRDLKKRLDLISLLKKDPGFPSLLTAAKRVYNILAKTSHGEIKESLLTEAAEKDLFDCVVRIERETAASNFRALYELEKPVNEFFDKVLVMDKNPEVMENRLALLMAVKKAFDSLADFSKIIE